MANFDLSKLNLA